MATTVELTRNDLLAIIGPEELAGRADEALADGQPDPIATMIVEGLATIRLYIDPYTLREDALKKIWRILAVAWLYNRLGRIPSKRKEEQEWALGVLEDIRDGKFPNLMVDAEIAQEIADGGGAAVAWGSNEKVTSWTGLV